MKQVIARHRSLYDEYPEDILNSILAETYELEGRYVLDKHLWSARAVSSFAKSTYLAPENKHRHFAEFIASLLGKPGLDILRRAKTLVKE